MNRIIYEDLSDPITFDWLYNPIVLPCCAKIISMSVILQHLEHNNKCPLCKRLINKLGKKSIGNIDISENSMIWKIHYKILVLTNPFSFFKSYINNDIKKEIIENNNQWSVNVKCLSGDDFIGKMNVYCKTDISKTLLIPVIHIGELMSDNMAEQIKFMSKHIVDFTYDNPHIDTYFIVRDYVTNKYYIYRKHPKTVYYKMISELLSKSRAEKASSYNRYSEFYSVFDKIVEICRHFNSNILNKEIVILFIGTNCRNYSDNKKYEDCLHNFDNSMKNILNVNYKIHIITSTDNCYNYQNLNRIRTLGNNDGMYCYVDGTKNDYFLCEKVSGIINSLTLPNSLPIDIKNIPFNILHKHKCDYWLDLKNINKNSEYFMTLTVNNGPDLTIKINFEDSNDEQLWNDFYAKIIDDIADELTAFVSIDQQLKKSYIKSIQHKITSILNKPYLQDSNRNKLSKIFDLLKIIDENKTINPIVIDNIILETKYPIIPYQNHNENVVNLHTKYINNICSDSALLQLPHTRINIDTPNFNSDWFIHKLPFKKIIINMTKKNDIAHIIANKSFQYYFKNWIYCRNSKLIKYQDCNNSNALMISSATGRFKFTKYFIEQKLFDVNSVNNYGYNACDIAIVYGYYRTLQILIDNGGTPSNHLILPLFKTCLMKKYYKTANIILKFVTIDQEFINTSPNYKIYKWLKKNC